MLLKPLTSSEAGITLTRTLLNEQEARTDASIIFKLGEWMEEARR